VLKAVGIKRRFKRMKESDPTGMSRR